MQNRNVRGKRHTDLFPRQKNSRDSRFPIFPDFVDRLDFQSSENMSLYFYYDKFHINYSIYVIYEC